MELTDAQLRNFYSAKQQNNIIRYTVIVNIAAAGLMLTGTLLTSEYNLFNRFFEIMFMMFVGMFIATNVFRRTAIKHFDAVMDIANMTVNSDASNISRLAKIQEKSR